MTGPWIYRRDHRLLAEADELLYAKIASLRLHPNDSIASRLVARSASEPEFWTDKRLRDMLATMLMAGHETSVSAYQWVMEFLVQHDNARNRLTVEARRAESDDIARACNAEAIGLKPPVWGQMMMAKKDLALAGYRIRQGTFVMMSGPALRAGRPSATFLLHVKF